ncbi:flippase [Pseudidiomarina sp. 1ASP75-14]|uniref:flippase n=1 Tax=Pseudidiomarina terrestris TaxID=2820060 RepID=UPI0026563404|nr:MULTISPECIES: flippase [unclassified Pseudidiomarina]MDN7126973.1 flippase [Pseudidiomarina sp. 1APR75-33.1]MDN7136814.1 flippase [Pseudidiomarina sp. 1ASP75-14]
MIRAALQNSSWLMSEKVIGMAMNLLVALVLARSLGPELFGQLNYVLALVALVLPLTALGMNALIMRELVEAPERETEIMSTAAAYRSIGAVVGVLGLFLWAFMSSMVLVERISLVVIGSAAILQSFQVVEFYFQAQVSARHIVKMRTAIILIAGLAKLAAVALSPSLLPVACVFALEYLAWGVGYIVLYQQKANGFRWHAVNWDYGWQLFKQAFWLVLSGIAAVLYLKIDQVMLGNMVDKSEVGIYAVAVKLSEVWYFFAVAIATSFFAGLIKLKQESPAIYQRRLQQLCDGLLVTALIVALAVTLLADPVVPWLFGDAYRSAAPILMIHIWASLFVFMRALASKWLIAERLLVFSLVSHGLGAVVNIAANWLLIPVYQGQGAAIATLISYAGAAYFAFWLSASTRPLAMIMTHSLTLPFTLGRRYWQLLGDWQQHWRDGKK